MEIFNHKNIKSDRLYSINSKDDIKDTPPNSIVVFNFSFDLCNYAKEQNLRYGVKVKDIKEIILQMPLKASYI